MAYRVSLVAALITLIAVGAGTAAAQSVDDVEVSLSDADGDGLDDSFVVDVQVTDDGAATAVRVNGPVGSLEVPSRDDDSSQAPVINVSENIATFGSTGYTGTYTVEGTLSGQSDGDTVEVIAWIGDVERSRSDDVGVSSATVLETVEMGDEDSDGADEGDETSNESTNMPKNDAASDEGKETSLGNGTSDESGDDNPVENGSQPSDDGDVSNENSSGTETREGLHGFTVLVALIALATTIVLVRRRN